MSLIQKALSLVKRSQIAHKTLFVTTFTDYLKNKTIEQIHELATQC